MSKTFDTIATEVNVGVVRFDTPNLNVDTNGVRYDEIPVTFDVPFSGIPKVAIAPTHFLCPNNVDLNFNLFAKDITKTGCKIVLSYGLHHVGSKAGADYTAVYHRKVVSNPAVQTNPLALYFNKSVYIYSPVNDAHVRNVNGVVGLSASKRRNEEFKVEDAGNGNINLLSIASGKYVCFDKVTGVVSHCDKPVTDANKSIDFFVTETSTGVYTFSDTPTGNKLNANSSYDVDMNGTVPEEQEFTVEAK